MSRSFSHPAATGLCLLALCLGSCARSHQRIDPDIDDNVGGGGTDSMDVRTMVSTMSRDLLADSGIFKDGARPTLYILALQNRGSHPIDREMILDGIQTELVRNSEGRLTVIDRSSASLEAIKAERQAKRDGAVAGNEKKALLGSDYVLTGTVSTISKRGRDGMSSDYWVYNYRMTDLESSAIAWANRYEFKWAGDKPAVYR